MLTEALFSSRDYALTWSVILPEEVAHHCPLYLRHWRIKLFVQMMYSLHDHESAQDLKEVISLCNETLKQF